MRIRPLVLPLLFALFALLPSLAAAQNPCQSPAATSPVVLANPAASLTFYIEAPELATANYITSLQLGTFLKGVSPATGSPIQSVTVQRSALVLVTGFPGCYQGTYGVLPSTLPRGVEHFVAARMTNGAGSGPWTAEPETFIAAGVPSAPANLRVGQ